MGIFDISPEEGERRSKGSILAAFVREFRKQGIADRRVLALRDAIYYTADTTISTQWKKPIEEFNQSLPLLTNGIAPNPNHELNLHLVPRLLMTV